MNTTSLNSATGSVLGLAELIGISHGKMRNSYRPPMRRRTDNERIIEQRNGISTY